MSDEHDYAMTTPTLMIGLGGLGCSIVQSVYADLPASHRAYTRAHVMDTDVAELKDARYDELHNNGWHTQTSPNLTVQECIQRLKLGASVTHWFPPIGLGSLGHKLMPKGAAQVRAVSRLALLDTINSDRVVALNRNIDSLLEKRSDDRAGPVRVLIVNSIAGGTGSGSFLQVALYVREYLSQVHGRSSVSIRGFVVMPEVFIRNGDYAALDLQANVKANGYAALKELDALVRLRAGLWTDPSRAHLAPLFPLTLEYAPGSKIAVEVQAGAPPFDVMTLFDFTGSDGANLANKFNYIAQVEDAIRFHLFSPLEGRAGIESQEDNLANTHLASGDRSRYAGCGTANLEYPFGDLVDYAALRWATDGISAAWMELDNLVTDEIRRVEQARREGNYLEMPDPHTRFCQLLRDKCEGPKPSPFYRQIFQDAHLLDEKGAPIEAKHTEWINKVEAKIKALVQAAVRENERELSVLSVEALKDPENVVSQVEQSEEGLRRFATAVEKRAQPIGPALAKEIFWKPFDDQVELVADDEAQVNTWVLGRDKPMHPIAIRYFLGEARKQLEDRLGQIRHKLLTVSRRVDGYATSWDDPGTNEVEAAADIARGRSGFFARIRGGLKDFAEEYRSRSEAQARDIELRAQLTVQKDSLELLAGYVEDFAEAWRGWFLRLAAVRQNARDEVHLLEVKHDESDDRTRVYVHASASLKQRMWDDERSVLGAKDFPPEISREMYMALYRQKGRQYREAMPPALGSAWVEDLFRGSVLAWCRRELRASPAFDMDISTAIKAELRLLQQMGQCAVDETEQSALTQYLNELDVLATPWIQAPGKGQRFEFLCMHPTTEQAWPQSVLNKVASARRVADGFSRYKISRVTLLHGLCAPDLLSMAGPHATYRAAYDGRLAAARALPPTGISPHLDFRWDSPAFLPELDDADQEQALRDLYRAVIVTLADLASMRPATVFRAEVDMRSLWHWSPHRGQQTPLPGVGGLTVESNTAGLLEVLAVNYGLVTSIVRSASEREARERAQPDSAPLISALGQVVDLLIKVPAEAATAQAGDTQQAALLLALFDEIHGIYRRALGAPNQARLAAEGVMAGVWSWSTGLKNDPEGAFAARVKRAIDHALTTA
jgi:hypothetical protein